jgi:hypothetical protein
MWQLASVGGVVINIGGCKGLAATWQSAFVASFCLAMCFGSLTSQYVALSEGLSLCREDDTRFWLLMRTAALAYSSVLLVFGPLVLQIKLRHRCQFCKGVWLSIPMTSWWSSVAKQ